MPCPKQVFTTNQGQRVMIVQCVSHVMSVLCAGSQQTNHGQNTKDTLLPVRLSRGNIRRMSLLQVSFLIFILTNLSNKHNFCLWLAIILFSMVEFQFTPLLISVTYATKPAMLHDSSGSNQKVTHMNEFLVASSLVGRLSCFMIMSVLGNYGNKTTSFSDWMLEYNQ